MRQFDRTLSEVVAHFLRANLANLRKESNMHRMDNQFSTLILLIVIVAFALGGGLGGLLLGLELIT